MGIDPTAINQEASRIVVAMLAANAITTENQVLEAIKKIKKALQE